MSLIDTNCLISYVTDRNLAQQEQIAAVIEDASRLRREVYVIGNVVTEFVYVLQSVYEEESEFIRALLSALFTNPGVSYLPTYPLADVLDIWPEQIGDYGDAVIAAAASELISAMAAPGTGAAAASGLAPAIRLPVPVAPFLAPATAAAGDST